MFIKVIKWANNQIPNHYQDSVFYLEEDNWNDYSYYTYFHLHLSSKYTEDGESKLIGGVKILKKEQEINKGYLHSSDEFDTLNSEYCSLGQSLDYYDRLAHIDKPLQDQLLSSINDIIFRPDIVDEFRDVEAFNISLMRHFDFNDDIFKLAPILISREFDALPDNKDLKFKFKTKEMTDFIEFDFDSPKYPDEDGFDQFLPNRIAVIIGKNGSGKTTLLSKISRIVFASASDRDYLKAVATIEPKGLGFPRIISLSYSAFDAFQVPGIRLKEKEQISKDIQRGIGRYIYCGVRDITKELEKSIETIIPEENGLLRMEDILNDKHADNFLKPINSLKKEFIEALKIIFSDSEKSTMLLRVIQILSEESSLHFIRVISHPIQENELIKIFSELSTGHKFVLHSLANIIKHIENRSLILFDEPETHLHPPLLAVLMKSMRYILNNKNSFMILSTHSPVVLQETLSKHVFIVRREGNMINVLNPEIQTFGENIGIITSHIFGLSSDLTDYHAELDSVISGSTAKNSKEGLEKIEALFGGQLSFQARAYVLSQLNN
ncbi:AAA family ATPase [Flavobacterium humi]|uniref:AAA+ ATPase domain-containing protein n=1 Tax=Flavobacterium humi TaxID=2562683 RepID=A0A4Z0L5J4_9FLAO|nr:AAA family ATPase [Flavobacterium humi]TGD57516.1 hypothetical protein E4635_09995 [Flavobacterium humi]